MKKKLYLFSSAALWCAIVIFTETNEGVQNSFLTAFIVLTTLACSEYLSLKDEG